MHKCAIKCMTPFDKFLINLTLCFSMYFSLKNIACIYKTPFNSADILKHLIGKEQGNWVHYCYLSKLCNKLMSSKVP